MSTSAVQEEKSPQSQSKSNIKMTVKDAIVEDYKSDGESEELESSYSSYTTEDSGAETKMSQDLNQLLQKCINLGIQKERFELVEVLTNNGADYSEKQLKAIFDILSKDEVSLETFNPTLVKAYLYKLFFSRDWEVMDDYYTRAEYSLDQIWKSYQSRLDHEKIQLDTPLFEDGVFGYTLLPTGTKPPTQVYSDSTFSAVAIKFYWTLKKEPEKVILLERAVKKQFGPEFNTTIKEAIIWCNKMFPMASAESLSAQHDMEYKHATRKYLANDQYLIKTYNYYYNDLDKYSKYLYKDLNLLGQYTPSGMPHWG